MSVANPGEVAYGPDGLAPAIVQDHATGRVLMVAHVNREAVQATLATGEAHFWSRSRGELWRKGATSGNTLEVVSMALDCDADAVLVSVRPAGPACHTGNVSCFGGDGERPGQGFAGLEALWDVIQSRADERPTGSYTVDLLAGGVDAVARKIIEEAGEVVVAAKNHAGGAEPDERVAAEAADLTYHLLVLLAERGISPQTLLGELAKRAGNRSGPG